MALVCQNGNCPPTAAVNELNDSSERGGGGGGGGGGGNVGKELDGRDGRKSGPLRHCPRLPGDGREGRQGESFHRVTAQ